MLLSTLSIAGALATLIIVANAPGGKTLIIGDSRVTHGAHPPYTYTDGICKIRIIRGVVVAGVGRISHDRFNVKTHKVDLKSWDTFEIASDLIRRHDSQPWTQEALDELASSWANAVRQSEDELESKYGANPLALAEGIFLARSASGGAIGSAIAVVSEANGLHWHKYLWLPEPYHYFGDLDAIAAAKRESAKSFGPSFGQLGLMELAGAKASATVHAPFAEIEISGSGAPRWMHQVGHCR